MNRKRGLWWNAWGHKGWKQGVQEAEVADDDLLCKILTLL